MIKYMKKAMDHSLFQRLTDLQHNIFKVQLKENDHLRSTYPGSDCKKYHWKISCRKLFLLFPVSANMQNIVYYIYIYIYIYKVINKLNIIKANYIYI